MVAGFQVGVLVTANLSTLTLFFSFYLLIFFETDIVEAAIVSLLELRCGCGHTGLIPGHGISCT